MSITAETKLAVNNGLTAVIVETLILQRREEYAPGFDTDRMDDKIAACKNRVARLRKMRDEFEDEMSKPL